VDEELALADPVSRLASAAVDGALLVTVATLILFTSDSLPPLGWFTFFIFTVYYWYFLGEHGKSVGNAMTGTLVTGGDGSRLGHLGAGLRTGVFMAPFAGLVAVFSSTDREVYTISAGALFLLYSAVNILGAALPWRRTVYDALTGTYVVLACGADPEAQRKAEAVSGWVLIGAAAYICALILVIFIIKAPQSTIRWC
jgi:uncharacterized RDD family membrane protein YckC